MSDPIGASGIIYVCRCGKQSKKVPSGRLMDAGRWSLVFEVMDVTEVRRDPKTGADKSFPVSRSFPVYLCESCANAAMPSRKLASP